MSNDVCKMLPSLPYAPCFYISHTLAAFVLSSVVSWIMPDLFTAQLDVAASVTEQMAGAAEDAESRRLLVDNASTLRHGSKVARLFKKSTVEEFEPGVRPSFEQTSDLATRYILRRHSM